MISTLVWVLVIGFAFVGVIAISVFGFITWLWWLEQKGRK